MRVEHRRPLGDIAYEREHGALTVAEIGERLPHPSPEVDDHFPLLGVEPYVFCAVDVPNQSGDDRGEDDGGLSPLLKRHPRLARDPRDELGNREAGLDAARISLEPRGGFLFFEFRPAFDLRLLLGRIPEPSGAVRGDDGQGKRLPVSHAGIAIGGDLFDIAGVLGGRPSVVGVEGAPPRQGSAQDLPRGFHDAGVLLFPRDARGRIEPGQPNVRGADVLGVEAAQSWRTPGSSP